MDLFALIDMPRSGSENMAMDEAMLQQAACCSTAFFRLYRWSSPTLSLGYFQKYADRQLHAESQQLDVVRRSTGGGAIVHDHDWTYSIAIPAACSEPNVGAAQPLYDCLHASVVEWLSGFGVEAQMWPHAECTPAGDCHFLCFQRRSLGDVVAANSKLMGSAQRRFQGAILQHGSLLLARSRYAPSLSGLAELVGDPAALRQPDVLQAFFQKLTGHLADFLQFKVHEVDTLDGLLVDWRNIEKYRESSWTEKR